MFMYHTLVQLCDYLLIIFTDPFQFCYNVVMKTSAELELKGGTNEESMILDPAFPYLGQRVLINEHAQGFIPWHFHEAIEIFYMEKGAMIYESPHRRIVFEQGDCGFMNSGVLHIAKPLNQSESVFLLHSFLPTLIAPADSLIYSHYIFPLINSQTDIVRYDDAETIAAIKQSFELRSDSPGYEITLRDALTTILFNTLREYASPKLKNSSLDTSIKTMMAYVYENYKHRITISELAQKGCCSERECYRNFNEYLHMPPHEFINYYRLNKGADMLIHTDLSITDICYECGFSSVAYFSEMFKKQYQAKPSEFRSTWQDCYNQRQKPI